MKGLKEERRSKDQGIYNDDEVDDWVYRRKKENCESIRERSLWNEGPVALRAIAEGG